jgi:hypothetical protein
MNIPLIVAIALIVFIATLASVPMKAIPERIGFDWAVWFVSLILDGGLFVLGFWAGKWG